MNFSFTFAIQDIFVVLFKRNFREKKDNSLAADCLPIYDSAEEDEAEIQVQLLSDCR